jgi:hypothetical protein
MQEKVNAITVKNKDTLLVLAPKKEKKEAATEETEEKEEKEKNTEVETEETEITKSNATTATKLDILPGIAKVHLIIIIDK